MLVLTSGIGWVLYSPRFALSVRRSISSTIVPSVHPLVRNDQVSVETSISALPCIALYWCMSAEGGCKGGCEGGFFQHHAVPSKLSDLENSLRPRPVFQTSPWWLMTETTIYLTESQT